MTELIDCLRLPGDWITFSFCTSTNMFWQFPLSCNTEDRATGHGHINDAESNWKAPASNAKHSAAQHRNSLQKQFICQYFTGRARNLRHTGLSEFFTAYAAKSLLSARTRA